MHVYMHVCMYAQKLSTGWQQRCAEAEQKSRAVGLVGRMLHRVIVGFDVL